MVASEIWLHVARSFTYIVYGLNMSKTATLDTFTIQTFYIHAQCCVFALMHGWWLFLKGEGGAASFQGGAHSPK